MTVRVLYFAWLRARVGAGEEQVEPPPGVTDVAGLAAWLGGRSAGHAEAFAEPKLVRIAVNQDYVGWDYPVRDGDEVAFFPPVTGG